MTNEPRRLSHEGLEDELSDSTIMFGVYGDRKTGAIRCVCNSTDWDFSFAQDDFLNGLVGSFKDFVFALREKHLAENQNIPKVKIN
ncbi:MAG TPA: hypothetical protein VFI60_05765 [Candidatus Acidoferrum sp.]|nr:hypothetical protein [Candidatus Acidoferrum sp.]